MMIPFFLLSCLATAASLAWLFVLFDPARPWDFRPVGDDGPRPENANWPPVCVLVPARNEAQSLPKTLPALLSQDYPGMYHVVLIDDRSSDGTADVARKLAEQAGRSEHLVVISGAPLPEGWVGKMWALEQGIQNAKCKMQNYGAPTSNIEHPASYFLLTDADILHAPGSLKRLVAESETLGLGLNSRMARLRCVSPAERLLIPPFVFFFNLLYPMRRVNDPASRAAAAAGGCVLLSARAIERIGGGFQRIRGEIIDDVNLARQVKGEGELIALSLSRSEVTSLREYPRLADVWAMVSRTAFTELKYSWLRLFGALLGLGLLFVVPVVALLCGVAGLAAAGDDVPLTVMASWAFLKGILALCVMRHVYAPAVRFFALPIWRAWMLPPAGFLYGLMTLDSALKHQRGEGARWRELDGQAASNRVE